MAPNVQSLLDIFQRQRHNNKTHQANPSSTSTSHHTREASTGIEMTTTDGKSQRHTETTFGQDPALMKLALVLIASALVFMGTFFILVQNDTVKLYPQNMQAESLSGFAPRVEYALRYQTLLVFWLTFNIMATIYGRVTTMAINPLDETTEGRVSLFKNVLTNSFESVVVSVFSQLIFVSFAQPATILRIIPLVNVIQFIGRVAFFAGYPMKRSFGFMCTLIPNFILSVYNLVKLGSFLGIY